MTHMSRQCVSSNSQRGVHIMQLRGRLVVANALVSVGSVVQLPTATTVVLEKKNNTERSSMSSSACLVMGLGTPRDETEGGHCSDPCLTPAYSQALSQVLFFFFLNVQGHGTRTKARAARGRGQKKKKATYRHDVAK